MGSQNLTKLQIPRFHRILSLPSPAGRCLLLMEWLMSDLQIAILPAYICPTPYQVFNSWSKTNIRSNYITEPLAGVSPSEQSIGRTVKATRKPNKIKWNVQYTLFVIQPRVLVYWAPGRCTVHGLREACPTSRLPLAACSTSCPASRKYFPMMINPSCWLRKGCTSKFSTLGQSPDYSYLSLEYGRFWFKNGSPK